MNSWTCSSLWSWSSSLSHVLWLRIFCYKMSQSQSSPAEAQSSLTSSLIASLCVRLFTSFCRSDISVQQQQQVWILLIAGEEVINIGMVRRDGEIGVRSNWSCLFGNWALLLLPRGGLLHTLWRFSPQNTRSVVTTGERRWEQDEFRWRRVEIFGK